jgi:RNA polymerase sigma-70 factor, ECF subfamily
MHILKGISAKTTDQELIERYKQTSDIDYVGELFSRYLHLIFSVALKYLQVKQDAEDMSIKIFEILKEKLPQQNIENFGGWINTVTRNACLMQLRSNSLEKQKEIDFARYMESEVNAHHNNENSLEIDLNKLEECIKKLNQEQKRCIELFYKQDKCYQEVANLTGYQLKKVKSYLQNGKRNLKTCMGG